MCIRDRPIAIRGKTAFKAIKPNPIPLIAPIKVPNANTPVIPTIVPTIHFQLFFKKSKNSPNFFWPKSVFKDSNIVFPITPSPSKLNALRIADPDCWTGDIIFLPKPLPIFLTLSTLPSAAARNLFCFLFFNSLFLSFADSIRPS